MDVTSLLNIPVTVTTPTAGPVDEYGDATDVPTSVDERGWLDVFSELGASTENAGWATAAPLLYLWPDTTATAQSQVLVDGELYECVGPPIRHRDPRTGCTGYVAVPVKRTT